MYKQGDQMNAIKNAYFWSPCELITCKWDFNSLELTYLSAKNAFSRRPVQDVATAKTKVVMPNVEWIGTKAARKDAVADSQHNRSKKLKKPTIN